MAWKALHAIFVPLKFNVSHLSVVHILPEIRYTIFLNIQNVQPLYYDIMDKMTAPSFYRL